MDGKIIIDKILADAEEAAKAIVAKGQEEADAILKAAKDKVNKELDLYDREASAEAEKAASKEISAAQMQAKKSILEAKQAILAEVLAEAEKRLLSLDDAAYADVIGKIIWVICIETFDSICEVLLKTYIRIICPSSIFRIVLFASDRHYY